MGYNPLLLIPAGATNIRVTESKASNNYLAVRNANDDYAINGDWKIDFAGRYDFAGTTFVYERKSPVGDKAKKKNKKLARVNRLMSMFAPEQITAKGPTTEPVYIVVSMHLRHFFSEVINTHFLPASFPREEPRH